MHITGYLCRLASPPKEQTVQLNPLPEVDYQNQEYEEITFPSGEYNMDNCPAYESAVTREEEYENPYY